ncbi:hypothetical protein, partial [Corynebacterium diphtheriae]|uniref:hypothetical protein n=1 Tax=Corynebacterium diphtheriae TaxID=1717 RepID=UPI0015E6A5C9
IDSGLIILKPCDLLAFPDAGLHKKQAYRHDGAKKNDKGDALFQLVAPYYCFFLVKFSATDKEYTDEA